MPLRGKGLKSEKASALLPGSDHEGSLNPHDILRVKVSELSKATLLRKSKMCTDHRVWNHDKHIEVKFRQMLRR